MLRFSTKSVSLIGVFAALHTVLYFMSFGLWRNWAIYLEPIEGIILGPWAGFLAALIGSVTARMIKPTDFWMFGVVAEPMGVLVSGLLAKGCWKPVLGIYAFTLAAYFLHPFGMRLPLWTILDILFALIFVYPVTRLGKDLFEEDAERLPVSLSFISFISVVTDSLIRVFLLVPAGLYMLFVPSFEGVYFIFVEGALQSYMEDALVIVVSLLVGTPLLLALRKLPSLKFPLS